MTLSEVISFADSVKPNAFTNAQKTLWISEAEGMVQSDVLLMAPQEITVYDYDEDGDTELLVLPPYDKLYRSYLIAMIDFYNGEYDNYQNTMTLFNEQLGEFVKWFARNYRPADVHPPMYMNLALDEEDVEEESNG